MVNVVPFQPEGSVLDMCCGTGSETFAIAERLGEHTVIKAIDLSAGQIRTAIRRNQFSNIEFKVMDASTTSFCEGEFNTVVIPHALHEMHRETRLAVLKEANRILAEGGTVAVLELDSPPSLPWRLFIGLWWFYWLPFNFETPTRRDMLKHGLDSEIIEAGFHNVSRISIYKGVLQVVVGTKRG